MSRICFVRPSAAPLFTSESYVAVGDAEITAFEFAQSLAERNHDVSFAVRATNGRPKHHGDIRLLPMPERSRGLARIVDNMRSHIFASPDPDALIESIDAEIIVCVGLQDPTPSVIEATRRSEKKTILFLTSGEEISSSQQRWSRFAVEHSDEVVCQTESEQRTLTEQFDRSSLLIRSPIDVTVADERLTQAREHVLWVGNVENELESLETCLELARHAPNIPFRLLVDNVDGSVRKLQRHTPNNVTLEFDLTPDQVEERFASATVLVNTSDDAALPYSFLQAAKYATPILSLYADPDGILSQKGCGEVAGSLESMATLIHEYHARTPRVCDKGADARRYVKYVHDMRDRVLELDMLIDSSSHFEQFV